MINIYAIIFVHLLHQFAIATYGPHFSIQYTGYICVYMYLFCFHV